MSQILLNLFLLIPFLAFFIILIISVLSGLEKTVSHTIARIGSCIGVGAIAFCVTPLLRERLVPRLWNAAVRYAGSDMQELASSLPDGAEGLRVLLGLLISPLLFSVTFLVIYIVFRVISAIALHADKIKPQRRKVSPLGTLIGIVHGILLATVLVMPLCGYMSVASDVITAFSDTGASAAVEAQEKGFNMRPLQEFADGVAKNHFLRTMRKTSGKWLFAPLTTGDCTTTDGTYTLKLETELPQIASAVGTTLCVSERAPEIQNAEKLTEDDRALLVRAKESLMASELIRLISSGAISRVSTAWSQDQPFLRMKQPQFNPVFAPTMQVVYHTLSDETPSYLKDDLDTCMEIFCQLSDASMLKKGLSPSDLMTRLGSRENGGLLRSIQETLRENPHLRALAGEIDALGMRAVAKVLEENGLADGQYDAELDRISEALNEVRHMVPEERASILQERVREAMQERDDIDIPDEVAVAMCEKILADMDADGLNDMDGEQLRNYLMEHVTDLSSTLPEETLPQ